MTEACLVICLIYKHMGAAGWRQRGTSHIRLSSSLGPARGLGGWKAVCTAEEVEIGGRGHFGSRLGVAGALGGTASCGKLGVKNTWGEDSDWMSQGFHTPPPPHPILWSPLLRNPTASPSLFQRSGALTSLHIASEVDTVGFLANTAGCPGSWAGVLEGHDAGGTHKAVLSAVVLGR
jgi:hypothetical protein